MTVTERREGSFKAVIEKEGAIVENLRGSVVGTAIRGTKISVDDKQRTEIWGSVTGKQFEMKSRTEAQVWQLTSNASPTGPSSERDTPSAPPVKDALSKGSIWRGVVAYSKPRELRHAWEIHVTERAGEYFKAEIVSNFQRKQIDGILTPDGRITWGPGSPRGIMSQSSKPNTEGTLKNGQLEFKQQDSTAELIGSLTLSQERTDDPYRIGDFPDLATVIGPVQAGPQVWHEIANLMSFAYLPPDRLLAQRLPLTDRLYVPFRSVRLANSARSGYAEADNAVHYRFDQIVTAAPPDQRQAATRARALLLDRLKLAQWNQVLGNTPDTSMHTGLEFLGKAMWKFKEFEDQMRKDDAERRGLTLEAIGKFEKFRQSIDRKAVEEILNRKRGVLPSEVEFSAYMLYRDMKFGEDQAELWRQDIVPLARKNAAAKAAQPPVELIPHWHKCDGDEDFERLTSLELRNGIGKSLTNVTVEVVLQNKWGDTGRQYYFFPELPAGSHMQGMLNLWWDRRVLPYSTDLKATYSVWADQASSEGNTLKLMSPKPCPKPESLRAKYSKFSEDEKVNKEFWGNVYLWSGVMLCSSLPTPHKP